jgi:membrane-bound lytic murein transglycosylase B
MRKRLKTALMTAAIATFLSLTPNLSAASSATIMASTDDSGHTVYVNDTVASSSHRASQRELGSAASSSTFRSQQNRLVFWSTTEHRWKTVPHANVRAARSAAAEVDQYLDKPKSEQNSTVHHGFTQKEIDDAINKAAERHAVDPNLVRALVKVESNFNPNAVSRKGAMGLMQLMPGTARELAVTDPFDPQQNMEAGVRHLRGLLDSYDGDVSRSLAAYNAGAKAVDRHKGIPPYAETQDYVRRITKLYGNGTAVATTDLGPQLRITRGPGGVLIISNTD